MESGTDTFVSSVQDHFARVWDMWVEVIGNIPDEEWRKGDIDQLIPARHVVHVLRGYDLFTADIPSDQYDGPFKGEWGTAPEALPSKQVALTKLAEMRATVEGRLSKLDDAALLEPEQVHPWTGQTRLGKMLFLLRHSQHHLGEINAELKSRGIRGYRRWY